MLGYFKKCFETHSRFGQDIRAKLMGSGKRSSQDLGVGKVEQSLTASWHGGSLFHDVGRL